MRPDVHEGMLSMEASDHRRSRCNGGRLHVHAKHWEPHTSYQVSPRVCTKPPVSQRCEPTRGKYGGRRPRHMRERMARSLWRARLWKASSVPLVIAEQRLHQLAGTCLGVGAMKKSVLHLQLRCPSQLSRHIRSDRLWALLARCSTGHRSRGSPMHRPGSPPLTPLRLCRGTYRGPCEARCATWPPTSRAAACALVTARPRNYRPRNR
mmetsp:Transcript_5004/g.15260  ORF Transcript_5004/g.15260 Transcript_5004/m.15260 type:complete len:208 (+) Transcript_5004:596-1219(+)